MADKIDADPVASLSPEQDFVLNIAPDTVNYVFNISNW